MYASMISPFTTGVVTSDLLDTVVPTPTEVNSTETEMSG